MFKENGIAERKDIVNGREPSPDEVQKHLDKNPGLGFYNAREELRNKAYGGKPPGGFQSWGDYWKSF